MAEVLSLRTRTPGAVTVACTTIGHHDVVHAAIDARDRRGALSAEAGDDLVVAVETAERVGVPFVGSIASSGADVAEGLPALHGWGRAARALVHASGRIPILMTADGPAVSGPALLLGLADQVVMTEDAYAFVSGPRMVRQFTGEELDAGVLGGVTAHTRGTGLASLVAPDREAALEAVGDVLGHLPPSVDEEPPRFACTDPVDRSDPSLLTVLPASPAGAYDVRDVVRAVVDDGEFLELRARWAPNLVTGLAVLGGWPVGVVANQPMDIAGTLDIASSNKGARFVSFCDAFGLPIVTLVDTPGFFPGKDLEWRGMIRHGAQLAFTYARATVPRLCVVLRKSYGGAYIVMDSQTMGNDLCVAWPSAEIAVMGARGAVEILHRRASEGERAAAELDYEERLLNPYVAADRGLVDAVIDPAETRLVLVEALAAMVTKQERLVRRAHDNLPL